LRHAIPGEPPGSRADLRVTGDQLDLVELRFIPQPGNGVFKGSVERRIASRELDAPHAMAPYRSSHS